MKQVYYFDIHDKDVTEPIYHLLFAYYKEFIANGNDNVHEINADEWLDFVLEDSLTDSWLRVEKEFNQRMGTKNNCFSGTYWGRPITLVDAVKHYISWLTERNASGNHIVKIWW